jgi:hypothetical protein
MSGTGGGTFHDRLERGHRVARSMDAIGKAAQLVRQGRVVIEAAFVDLGGACKLSPAVLCSKEVAVLGVGGETRREPYERIVAAGRPVTDMRSSKPRNFLARQPSSIPHASKIALQPPLCRCTVFLIKEAAQDGGGHLGSGSLQAVT